MNKPLPWNVKGVGFDAREAARLAARRAGVPLGEWLNTVISTRAAELGVGVDDIEAEDRLDAIAARLSDRDAPSEHAPSWREDRPNQHGLGKAHAPATRMSEGDAIPSSGTWAGTAVGARFATDPTPQKAARVQPPRRTSTPAPTLSGPAGPAEASQLDERLNSILAKLNRSFEAAAQIGAEAVSPRPMEAAGPVRASGGGETQAMVPPPAPPGPSARFRTAPAPVATSLPRQDTAGYADLHEAFRTLAAKLEAQLDDPSERAATAQEPTRRAIRSQREEHGSADVRIMQQELAALATRVAELTPQQSFAALEAAVRDLAGRMDLSRLDGVGEAVLAPVERLGREMREAIRSADATEAVASVRQEMRQLATRLDAQATRSPDAQKIDGLREDLSVLRAAVAGVAERLSGTDRLQDEIAALGERVGALADRTPPSVSRDVAQAVTDIRELLQGLGLRSGLTSLDRKLDTLSAQVGAIASRPEPDAQFAAMLQQIERAHETLAQRLTSRATPAVDVSGLERSIGALTTKIDLMGTTTHDVNALYGLVGTLADRMQEARDPDADGQVLGALQAQIGHLVERLDRTEAGTAAVHGLEKLMGDLFLQIEQSRNVAIDAAENAARAAAQDTLRAAMDNPALNGTELTVQTGLDVDHVSQELAELRRVQEASDRRVTTTLTALNTTLERLVDHLSAPIAATPSPVQPRLPEVGPGPERRRRRAAAGGERFEDAPASALPPFDPEQFLLEPNTAEAFGRRIAPKAAPDVAAAPVPKVSGDESDGVAPLIAAARRAAQAAQASALEASLASETADGGPSAQPGKVRSFFANRRRPLLLGLAGLVLLLGTLQIVRLSTQAGSLESGAMDQTSGNAEPSPPAAVAPQAPAAIEPAAPKPDKGASLLAPPSATAVPTSFTAAADPLATGSIPGAASGTDLDRATGLGKPLRDRATGGDAGAQFEVANRLADGKGVERDPKAAVAWYQRAAQQGLAPAQYRLGSSYEKGVGVPADPALAISWYEKAARAGNIRAMHNLAVMAAEGAGNKPDYAKAVTWFTKAASYGIRDSQYNLAVLFARGLGVPQDLGQSYAWFALAAQQGDTDAVAKRDMVAAKLDAKALGDAKANVASFRPLTSEPSANDVQPPAGGWDAPAKTASSRKVEARISSM